MDIFDLPREQLQRAADIKAQIEKLNSELSSILGPKPQNKPIDVFVPIT